MSVVIISLLILAAGLVATTIGKIWLSYYGFRYGAGTGILVLLFDPATFWFAFYKLEKEGKEMMTALWLGGIVLSAVALLGFYGPIFDGLSGEAWTAEYADAHASGPVDSVLKKTQGTSTTTTDATPDKTAPEKVEPETPAATPDAGATEGSTADGGAANAPTPDGGAAPAAPAEGGAAPAAPAEGGAAPAAPAGGAAPAP